MKIFFVQIIIILSLLCCECYATHDDDDRIYNGILTISLLVGVPFVFGCVLCTIFLIIVLVFRCRRKIEKNPTLVMHPVVRVVGE